MRLDKDGKPKAQWNGTVRLVPEHLGDPLRWSRPRRVFVNSMSDLFHESLPFEVIAMIYGVMAAAPRHTFQVLTKRPERAVEFFAWCAERKGARWREVFSEEYPCPSDECLDWARNGFPVLQNVWLGTSVEDEESASTRMRYLYACQAAVMWASYEPAIGPVDFEFKFKGFGRTLDWLVIGGESGPNARPFDIAWARSAIAQCREAGVSVFVKQLGAHPYLTRLPEWHEGDGGTWRASIEYGSGRFYVRLRDRKGGDPAEWPSELRVREYPR